MLFQASNRSRRYGHLLAALCFAGAVSPMWAQTGTGSIQGTVTDPSGAVVPGATVTVTQTQTAQQRTMTTNQVGYYLVPSVNIGPYEISISAAGMETWKGQLTLEVGQTAVVNAGLKVRATTTEVTVAGDVTPMVTTNSATISTDVERTRIEQLPLNTRLIYTLIANTTPGVELGSSGPSATFKTFGLRFATDYLQDGTPIGNRNWGNIAARPPGIDSVEEFRTETNNSSAKLTSPATVISTTRSGTNQVHGSVFETARNNGIGVARARTDYYTKPPQLIRNEFGASLGGPVYIPKIYNGKNRTFFFIAYEALRSLSSTTLSATMPTPAMRQGDFSGLVNSQGRLYTLYNPWTTDPTTWSRQPFSYNGQLNVIDPSLMSPLAKYLYSITPLPTLPNVNPLAAPNWLGLSPSSTRDYTLTTRIDHRLSDRDQLFFRFTHAPHTLGNVQSADGVSPPTLDNKWNQYIWPTKNDGGAASWTHTFSPTLFSETIVNAAGDYFSSMPIAGISSDLSTGLGLPNPLNGGGYPWIYDLGGFMTYYPGTNYGVNYRKILNFDENLTKIHGRHQLQFGGRYHYEFLDDMMDQTYRGGYADFASLATSLYSPTSGSTYTAVPFTGQNVANFYLGIAAYYNAVFYHQFFNMRDKEIAGYFQDDFKVNSRLTLNLGLRYEYNSPHREVNNLVIGFDAPNHAIVVPGSTDYLMAQGAVVPSILNAYSSLGAKFESQQTAGIPEAFVYRNPFDFGPRLGFAYRIGSDKRSFVVRGGYSIYGFPSPERTWDSALSGTMPFGGTISQNWNNAAQTPDGLPNYLLRTVPTVIAGVNSLNAINLNSTQAITRGSGTVAYFDPNQPTSRAHEWNLTLERELLRNTSLTVGYVGTHGARLDMWNSYNDAMNSYIWYVTTGQPLPTGAYSSVALRPYDQVVYGTVKAYQKTGWSNSQSFQVEVQHRYSKGYAFQAFYRMTNALYASTLDVLGTNMLYSTADYLPGAVPADPQARMRFLNYMRDPETPKHRFNYNWVADLPFGKGKRLAGRASGLVEDFIGGWQLAGSGTIVSNWWTLPTSNYLQTAALQIYGKKYPIQDCRSGVCYPGYLYWNGYIPANLINSHNSAGQPNGVEGVPSTYVPFSTPLIPTPANGGSSTDPLYPYYESNTVWVPLANGTVQRIAYNNNLNPFRNQYNIGPLTYMLNASLFKSVQIREHLFLRFNADFFNVLNLAGTPQPGSDGIIQMRNSANTPRQLQLTGRLTW